MNHKLTLIAGAIFAGFTPHAHAQYPGWQHQGSCFILTTPQGAGGLTYQWTVAGGAVIKEITSDRLILKRSQCSNKLTVKLALGNGGADTIATTSIQVREPKQDAWVQRVPARDEQPEDNQFYARDDKNEGTLFYTGTILPAAFGILPNTSSDQRRISVLVPEGA